MSLRLSHTQTVLAVAGVLLLLSNLYLGLSCLSAQDQRDQLLGQYQVLELSFQRLAGAPEPGSTAATEGSPADPIFPKSPPGIELTDLVIRAARETGAEILGLHSSSVGTEQIGNGTYRVVRVDLRLRGDPGRLVGFFDRLERGATPTMVFDNIQVARGGEVWEMSLELLAYGQST